ncbi:hypothetical protein B0H66DRAFT_575154 [Apodospora peruviana]|uniref:Uncharacterized protein n=1 Tax=Apodospora peruviana TaxID=516989 RepID=A0AAE0I4M2_9PEZI|nr:hypothetical protein B0H66DRAFT_575154 [Apodospora peruviana]
MCTLWWCLWRSVELGDFLLQPLATTLIVDNAKLGRLFTASNLNRIGGINIRWTTNLADHLRLTDNDHAVFTFQGASFLQFQNGYQQDLKLPPGLDRQIGKCGTLRTRERRIENFSIWHDRLVILKQAFDESQPAAISQWWYDRRNGVQWYIFWIAVMVFVMAMFFGIMQSLEGGLQVYLSYKSMNLPVEAGARRSSC